MARRALDYLVGFNISPILWTKLSGSKSAGRVQSVALRLITEREHEIELFKPEEFWNIESNFQYDDKLIKSKLSIFDDNKVEKFTFKRKENSEIALNKIKSQSYKITDVTSKIFRRNPLAPLLHQLYNKRPLENLVLELPEQCRLHKGFIKELI